MVNTFQPDIEAAAIFPTDDEILWMGRAERLQLLSGVQIAYDAEEISRREWRRVIDAIERSDPELAELLVPLPNPPAVPFQPSVFDEAVHAAKLVLMILGLFSIIAGICSWWSQ